MIDGIEKIKQKLAEELAAKEVFLKEQTAKQITAIMEQAEKTIKQEEAEQLAWRKKYAEQEEQRLLAKGNIERKKIRLEINQQIIDELLYKLEQQLINLSAEKKVDLYVKSLPQAVAGDVTLEVAEKDAGLIETLRADLIAKDASWQNVAIKTNQEMSGGILLSGTDVSEDHSFVELLRKHNYELLQIIKQNVLIDEA